MKDLLMYLFTKLVIKVQNKLVLSLSFIFASAFLSAFLDALTVTAVVISVAVGFYTVYKNVADQQIQAVDNDLMRESNQVMPISTPNRSSKVTFGKGGS